MFILDLNTLNHNFYQLNISLLWKCTLFKTSGPSESSPYIRFTVSKFTFMVWAGWSDMDHSHWGLVVFNADGDLDKLEILSTDKSDLW